MLCDALLLDPYPFDIWVAYRTDSVAGSGTLNDPYDGSTQARFDSLMSTKVGPNTRVHLGPGTFETRGYSDEVSSGWQIQAGVKIIGSGIDVTTLQLVDAQTGGTAARLFAIGHALTTGAPAHPNLVDFAEVCDLTVDCDLAGQSGSQVACGAVRLMGNHVKVSRVKAKNWGTKTGSKPCFVIAVITGDRSAGFTEVTDTGIEGCIAVEPDTSMANVGPAIALHAGGREESVPADNAEAYGTGPYIRNCFVDCGNPTATPECRGLSMGWCRGGIVEGNQVHNTKYGGPYQDKASSREVIVRDNAYKNVAKGPFWNLGVLSPATPTALISLFRDLGYDPTGQTALATTDGDHNLQIGERVKIDASAGTSSYYKGVFVIKEVPSSVEFRYQMEGNPADDSTASPTMQKVLGVGKLLVEGNIIELATGSTGETAIHLADTEGDAVSTKQTPDFRHGDVVVRRNKIRYLDGWFDPQWEGVGVKIAGAKNVIVSENVVDCAPANPIKDFRCGTVAYSHNDTAAGALVQGYDGVANSKHSEPEMEAEDAMLLSLV